MHTEVAGTIAGIQVSALALLASVAGRGVRSLGREDALEEEMATHSSNLAWEIPGTEEPGRL